MGYYTSLSGEATIKGGAIPEDVLEREGWLPVGGGQAEDYFIIETDGDPDDVQLVDGEITVIPGNQWQRVTIRWDDQTKAYNFKERCDVLLAEVTKTGATIKGEFKGVGEEQGDVWRIKFVGKSSRYEEAEMRWPDGSSVK